MPTQIAPKDRIILPLDVSDVKKAIELVQMLSGHVGLFKIGLEFIWSTVADLLLLEEEEAIALLRQTRTLARTIGASHAFIDGKLCDIPNTVKGASVAISRLGVNMFNLHASAGKEAIKAAVASKGNSLVLGVTVLTSLGEPECYSIFGNVPGAKVYEFAEMLLDAKADGIICSPKELEIIRRNCRFSGLLTATPGVRPIWAAAGDQKRIMTPGEAIKAGADYLVIGRPITKPPVEIGGPIEAAKAIADEIAKALEEKGGENEP
jgi:orotidine-5'-phosphate decarboxylase